MIKTQVVVIGSGPGGYTAAFRAADLGLDVTLVERYENLGGVCLNVGCIPSKTLLHTAELINESYEASKFGVTFDEPKIDIDAVRANKDSTVAKLTGGIKALAKARKVNVVNGYAKFSDANHLQIDNGESIEFENCIIAAGSRVTKIPSFPFDDPRVMDSTDALELENIPKRLLVVGGGIIGLEMATVYSALGSEITIVELSDQIIAAADKDIVTPLFKKVKKQYKNIFLETKVTSMEPIKEGIQVSFEGKNAPQSDIFDKVLVSIGRSPNGNLIDADKAGITLMIMALFLSISKCGPIFHIFLPLEILWDNPCWRIKQSMKQRWLLRSLLVINLVLMCLQFHPLLTLTLKLLGQEVQKKNCLLQAFSTKKVFFLGRRLEGV